MSGAIRFDSVGTQNISKGSFDSGRGGYNGISLVCAVDYELNWQSGYLKALNSGGFAVPINSEVPFNIYSYTEPVYEEGELVEPAYTRTLELSATGISHTDGQYGNTFSINSGGFSANNEDGVISFNVSGLTFGDGTVQTTAFGGPNGGLVINNNDGDPFFTADSNTQTVFIGDNQVPNNGTEISNNWITVNGVTQTTTGTMIFGRNYNLGTDVYGVQFYDNSFQTTAFIPENYYTQSQTQVYVNNQGFVTSSSLTQYAQLSGSTFTGKVNVNTGTGNVPLNIGITGTPTAYTNGDVWITGSDMRFRDNTGVTKVLISAANSNAFTTYQSISSSNSTQPALKITQLGTGEALRVEDETSPDATAFVISNTGRVGVGVAPDATVALTVDSTGIKVNGMVIVPATTVTNSIYTGSTMHHDQYTKELIVTLGGVQYGIPLRVV